MYEDLSYLALFVDAQLAVGFAVAERLCRIVTRLRVVRRYLPYATV